MRVRLIAFCMKNASLQSNQQQQKHYQEEDETNKKSVLSHFIMIYKYILKYELWSMIIAAVEQTANIGRTELFLRVQPVHVCGKNQITI